MKPLFAKRIVVFALIISILAAFCVFNTTFAVPLGNQTTTFINIGQGDAALLTDGSGFNVLIDGGKPAAGPGLLAFLHDQAITTINVMVASHADSDHIGGLIDVLNDTTISVGQVIYNGYPGNTLTWTNFSDAVTRKGLTLTAAQFPQVLSWGNMTAHVMNPASGLSNPETNDASVVILVDFVNTKYLFTGDISSTIEATVIGRGTALAADVLKVAHHGSAYSSSDAFLSAVNPKDDVISVGVNSYGHPSTQTVSRLIEHGGNLYRTDLNGNVKVTNNGVTYSIVAQLFPIPTYVVYIPLVHREMPAPTATPAPTTVTPSPTTATPTTVTPTTVTPTAPPPPTGANVQCNTSGTAQICAWVSNVTPSQNSNVTVYGRLYNNNLPQSSLSMGTSWHYKSTTSTCSGTTDAQGTASCSRSIGGASKGYQVNVDVSIGGYNVTTWFTPQ